MQPWIPINIPTGQVAHAEIVESESLSGEKASAWLVNGSLGFGNLTFW